jgi:MFS family permease
MPLRSILRSFSHRNFRLFFTGQGLSLIGTQMQIMALPWFVDDMTKSAFWVGAVAFAGQFPAVFATPFAGVIADRVNKRRLLVITQTLAMAQALALAILTLTGAITLWHIMILNIGMGLVTAFDLTTRQAFLNDMIDDPEDLGNAIALNSSVFNASRLVGPALAGMIIPIAGAGWCFLMNAVSFLAVLIALLRMRLPHVPRPTHRGNGSGLIEGAAYALRSMPIRTLLLLAALVSFLAVPYLVMLPVFVRVVFEGDAQFNGWLYVAAGFGALIGGLFLAARRSVLGLVRFLPLLPGACGLSLCALSFVDQRLAALLLVFVIGLSLVTLLTACNTVLQTIVDDHLRGRILSLYALTLLGLAPLGSVAAGAVAENLSVYVSLRISGISLLAATVVLTPWLSNELYRRVQVIYQEKRTMLVSLPEATA